MSKELADFDGWVAGVFFVFDGADFGAGLRRLVDFATAASNSETSAHIKAISPMAVKSSLAGHRGIVFCKLQVAGHMGRFICSIAAPRTKIANAWDSEVLSRCYDRPLQVSARGCRLVINLRTP